ncbi:MAG: ATP-dependent DNA helicase RecG [Patescibacteria group bacterium]|jgi:ATP-dependent DNA helicase RecG
MNLDTSISSLNKVGKTTSLKLHRLGIFNVQDLLNHFPFRYEDYSRVTEINNLKEGESVTIKGVIELIANRRVRNRRFITEALVNDESGSIRVVWFNQPFLIKNLHSGDQVFLSGTVKRDMLGPQFVSPAYEKAGKTSIHTGRLVPMYPLTEGVTQKQLRFLVEQSMPAAVAIQDWLPEEIKTENNLVSLNAAIREVHFPQNNEEIKIATERLKFDELFLVQLRSELLRLKKGIIEAPKLTFHEEEIKKFVAGLPFALTKDQKVAAWEILQNIAGREPMNRLLSGDVGSGKTVVAAMALYNTVLSGFQGIMMAPTEILATQHFASIKKLLPNNSVALFTRSSHLFYENNQQVELSKKDLTEVIHGGKAQIVLGTHALLSEGVEFGKAGLVIVDEQHRFGVAQRKEIKEKPTSAKASEDRGKSAHFLSMTATPIPRSLALLLYGDLDISQIKELPPGRKPVMTKLVEARKREAAYGFIKKEVTKGRQVFVVCPLIENATPLDEKKSVLSEYKKLSEKIFPELRVAYLHGRLPAKSKPGGERSKEEIMADFKEGKIDILVSTSVIEVGVDVPNASIMMIEGAERFGLAQLHQFRGRVGRGAEQSYCFLFVETETQKSKERLQYFEAHQNGFELAEKDLELRGPGEVYGTSQSGMTQLRLAKITDVDLIKKARTAAQAIVKRLSEFPLLEKRIKDWETTFHLE